MAAIFGKNQISAPALRLKLAAPPPDHLRYPDPSACPRCGVVFADGRWQWTAPRAGTFWVLCPACRRIEDGYPAGTVRVAGPIGAELSQEIVDLIHDEAVAERSGHPLDRLVALDASGDAILAMTTGTHLAQRIADALRARYEGSAAVRYGDDDSSVTVDWSFA